MSNNQIAESVLNTADRKATQLFVGNPADRGVVQIQVPAPSISAALKRRPDVGERAAIAEPTTDSAVAGQKPLKP